MGKQYKKESNTVEINCTMGDIVRSQGILGLLNNARMPVTTGLQVRRIIKTVTVELELFNETRKSLLDQFGEKDENGELVIEKNEYKIIDRKAFDKAHEDLMQSPVKLLLRPLSIDELESIEIPSSVLAGTPPTYSAWKPLPIELDAIVFLLDLEEEPEAAE